MEEINEEKVSFFQRRWTHIGLIILLTFGVYANSFRNKFVYDDHYVIVENNFIKNWKNFPKIFTKEYFIFAQELSYRPICTLSFFIDYFLWKLNVFGWHLTNVSFHTANAILVYFLVFLILSHSFTSSLLPSPAVVPTNFGTKEGRSIAALFTALLFVLHPIQTETVSGISFREDLISFFFFLLAFYFYIKFTANTKSGIRHPISAISYFASCVSFILALFSKEMAITLPFILILYDYCFTRHTLHIKHFTRRYFAYFLIAGLYLLGRYFLFNPTGILFGIDISQSQRYPGGSFFTALLTMSKVAIYYLYLFLLPIKLSVDHVFPASITLFDPIAFISIVFLIFILIFSVKLWKYLTTVSFSIFYFFIVLLPVSNIIPFGAIMAERYLYFSSLVFCLCLSITITKGLEYWQKKILRSPQIFYALCVIIFVFYSLRTIKRNTEWRDDFTLWSKTIQSFPQSSMAHRNLGLVYAKRGWNAQAITEFKQAIEIDPHNAEAYYNLGIVYFEKNLYEQAITEFRQVIKIKPKFAEAYNNLGVTYFKKGWYDQAITKFKQAIEIKPKHIEAHNNLKIAYTFKRMKKEISGEFKKIMEIESHNVKMQENCE